MYTGGIIANVYSASKRDRLSRGRCLFVRGRGLKVVERRRRCNWGREEIRISAFKAYPADCDVVREFARFALEKGRENRVNSISQWN